MGFIKLTGHTALQRALIEKTQMQAVKTIVQHNGAQMNQKMVQNAEFEKGYQTGATKRSIRLEIKDGGLTAACGPQTEYSPYVEYGTRYMSAQPFVRPAYNEQKEKFKNDLDKLVR